MKYKNCLTVALLSLTLAGCGQGYEARPYHGGPYNNADGDARTAGSGVEYVLAHLAPPATLDTKPEMKVEAPAPKPTTAVSAVEEKKGDAVFHKASLK